MLHVRGIKCKTDQACLRVLRTSSREPWSRQCSAARWMQDRWWCPEVDYLLRRGQRHLNITWISRTMAEDRSQVWILGCNKTTNKTDQLIWEEDHRCQMMEGFIHLPSESATFPKHSIHKQLVLTSLIRISSLVWSTSWKKNNRIVIIWATNTMSMTYSRDSRQDIVAWQV